MQLPLPAPCVAIACGGTGGHLFPGLAVAEQLMRRDCAVTLLVSQKEVDQQAVRSARDMTIVTLPAVGLTRKNFLSFWNGFLRSYRAARQHFRHRPVHAALAMGGFTSAPPLLAARRGGAKTFLHESNTIPGRANRWLAHWVDHAFVYFHEASGRLSNPRIEVTGMPVREDLLQPIAAEAARTALGLDPNHPVVLIMGGSQGARGVNDLVIGALPALAQASADFQFIHLTGPTDAERVEQAYARHRLRALVRPFLTEMELALRAATVAISRAGASSLAELAAVQLPAILIPYPEAADDHQFYNAVAFADSGAGRMTEERETAPERLGAWIIELVNTPEQHRAMRNALAKWHVPDAAEKIAEFILHSISSEVAFSKGAAPLPAGASAFESWHPMAKNFSRS